MPHMDESAPRIPNKQYFRIGEVSRIIGVPTYVLRFWETEFRRIKPRRTATGQRIYHRSDLATIQQVKSLLYDQQFTIKGARKLLNRMALEQKQAGPMTLEQSHPNPMTLEQSQLNPMTLGQSQLSPPASEKSQQKQLPLEQGHSNQLAIEKSQQTPLTQDHNRIAMPPDRRPAPVDHDMLGLLRRELKTIRDLLA